MNVTTLMTMPRAASLPAARLYKLVEEQVPISITLGGDEEKDRLLIVNKYLGMDDRVGSEFPFEIRSGAGIALQSAKGQQVDTSEAPAGAAPAGTSGDRVRFSSAVFGDA